MTAVVLVGLAAVFVYKDNKHQTEPVITYSTSTPDESKNKAVSYKWSGEADEPKTIRINKIGVEAYIQKSGIDQNQKVAVPTNVHLASWFKDSQKPGQKGLAIISGHVSGSSADGIFKHLDSLQKNDEFEIQLGNGEIKRYEIFSVKKVKESESAQLVFSQHPKITNQVNLVTCGGNYDHAVNQYEDRLIISGTLL